MNQIKPKRRIIRNGKPNPVKRNNHKRSESENDSAVGIGSKNYQKALQSRDKYRELAREALVSGDRVAAEGYFQHADHYNRVISEAHEAEEVRAAAPLEETIPEMQQVDGNSTNSHASAE